MDARPSAWGAATRRAIRARASSILRGAAHSHGAAVLARARAVAEHPQARRRVPPPPLDQVDSLIGTGSAGYGQGQNNPGAQYPFGALRLGPDTSQGAAFVSFNHFGGYYYRYARRGVARRTRGAASGSEPWAR